MAGLVGKKNRGAFIEPARQRVRLRQFRQAKMRQLMRHRGGQQFTGIAGRRRLQINSPQLGIGRGLAPMRHRAAGHAVKNILRGTKEYGDHPARLIFQMLRELPLALLQLLEHAQRHRFVGFAIGNDEICCAVIAPIDAGGVLRKGGEYTKKQQNMGTQGERQRKKF
ncbi:MAG: hypothetical protein ILNGONEN_01665 [Syntrophorhabdaceae bacterium]|nr:hypothetical protein [Syntrophorhabdaceae bacterium]